MSSSDSTCRLPSADEVQHQVNERHNVLFGMKEEKASPRVCGMCNEFILHERDTGVSTEKVFKTTEHMLSWDTLTGSERIAESESHCQFTGCVTGLANSNLFKNLSASPRASLMKKMRRSKVGLLVSVGCKTTLENDELPFCAIINKNCAGGAPLCLAELNDVELAFSTAVKAHGHCFHCTGGTQMQLKRALAFMHVQERRMTKAAVALQMLRLAETLICIPTGKMTKLQCQRAKLKSDVRTDKCIAAAK